MFSEPDYSKYEKVTFECKDLITKLLDKNSKTRISIKDVKEHSYFNGIDFDQFYRKEIKPIFIPRAPQNEKKDLSFPPSCEVDVENASFE
jgi:serine/threonine protein kinase